MKRQFSAGGVVYKKIAKDKKKEVFWLITKATPSTMFPNDYWRLPKGWLDDAGGGIPGPLASGTRKASEEELHQAALREVREEAGVEATIIKKLGTIKYSFSDGDEKVLKFVTFYLMEWRHDLAEGFGFETEDIQWTETNKAVQLLNSSNEKKILKEASLLV